MKAAILLACALVAAAAPAAAERVARVSFTSEAAEEDRKRIRAEFAAHGFFDGRNLALRFEQLREFPDALDEDRARAVVASRPDAIVTLAGQGMHVLHRLTRDIPIVFYNLAMDPARLGLVESLRRPGGNLTGTSHNYDLLNGRVWAMLKEIKPAVARGGVLVLDEWVTRAPMGAQFWPLLMEGMCAAGARFGIEMVEVRVARRASVEAIGAALREARVDAVALQCCGSPELFAYLRKAGIPGTGSSAGAKQGLLLGTAFDFVEGEKQAVAITARILRGERPSEIPVYQGTRYGVAVNVATAAALGLKVPESVLVQVNRVYGR